MSVRVKPACREAVVDTARGVRAAESGADGWVRLDLSFEDLRHAVWALWQFGTDVEALAPYSVRAALRDRAAALAARYAPLPSE